jgi:hypothetical protein
MLLRNCMMNLSTDFLNRSSAPYFMYNDSRACRSFSGIRPGSLSPGGTSPITQLLFLNDNWRRLRLTCNFHRESLNCLLKLFVTLELSQQSVEIRS